MEEDGLERGWDHLGLVGVGDREELRPKRPQTRTAKTRTATTKSIHQNGEDCFLLTMLELLGQALEAYQSRFQRQEPCCRRETARSRVHFNNSRKVNVRLLSRGCCMVNCVPWSERIS